MSVLLLADRITLFSPHLNVFSVMVFHFPKGLSAEFIEVLSEGSWCVGVGA